MPDPVVNESIRNCDVVMKGGITSGVVYPRAISELAKHFRLKNIGGTSAGAIAAATAAAAQYRAMKGNRSGFDDLENLPAFLGEKNETGSTNLFSFFQPQKRTKRLFYTLIGALEAKGSPSAACRVFGRALLRFPLFIMLGVIPGAVLVTLGMTHHAGALSIASVVLGAGLAITGAALGAAAGILRHFGKRIPRNFFGFCTGMSTKAKEDDATGPSKEGQALTVWLTKYLNELAGLDANGDPLTFGQLWWPNLPAGSNDRAADPKIRLEMFTTCLSMGRPFRLPFRSEESVRENAWYFRECDFRRFFPAKVVEWMKNHPRETRAGSEVDLTKYLAMPDPWNLPVVVATRMSLSFPILLSAVPLYARKLDPRAHGESAADEVHATAEGSADKQPMALCWFSDGGICSNFPLHFFDAPVPGWPTFGINLVEENETIGGNPVNPWMPTTNNTGIHDRWIKVGEAEGITALFSFVGAIIATMQNWSDNTLSRMPGYRDRIAHVSLTKEEGGLNLQMPAARIDRLSDLGRNAAVEFARRFATPEAPQMNWSNHRWIRFRSMLASVVEMVKTIDYRCANPQPGDEGYETWIDHMQVNQTPSYHWKNQAQRTLAIETLAALRQLGQKWNNADASDGAPRPRPELRPRPRT